VSPSAGSVAERIRSLVLQGAAGREEIRAAAESHADQVRQVNADLARCAAWTHRGLLSEAVSLGEALDVARRSTALRLEGAAEAWAGLLRTAGLGGVAQVDVTLLEGFVAAAGRHQAMAASLAAMRHAALRRAPLAERLFTLRALVDREPRQPAWLEGVRRLEREAATALADAARRSVEERDPVLAAQVVAWAEQLTIPMDEHREVLARAAELAAADRQTVLLAQARSCADRLHAAATAMDWSALEQVAREWQELTASWDPGAGLRTEVEPPLDLLKRERERRREDRARTEALQRLELALDQAAPAEELERLADVATRADAALPPAIGRRLDERRQREASARGRRRAVLVAGVVLLVGALGIAGWFGWQWRERERRLSAGVAMVDASLASGDLAAAEKVLDAISPFSARPEWIAASQRVKTAREADQAARAAAEATLREARALAETGKDPVVLEARALELRAASERQRADQREAFAQAATALQAAAAALRERAAGESRMALQRLQGALAAVNDPAAQEATRFDRTAWSSLAQRLNGIADEARTAATAAAGTAEGRTAAEALGALASSAEARAKAASDRADRLDRVVEGLKRVERFSADEQVTLDQWERLLAEGGDLLAARGMLRSCEAGRDAARAGVAIRAWRTVVVPALVAGRTGGAAGLAGLDWGEPGSARQLDTTLTRHLDEQPATPHRAAAEALRALARRTMAVTGSSGSLGSAAMQALRQMGYAGLVEQSFDGGRVLYRRRAVGSTDAWGQAIESRSDLARDPSQLRARKPVTWRPTARERAWPAAAVFATGEQALQGAEGRASRDAWLRMLADLRAAETSDPLMQWHAMRDLWRGWLQLFADETDPEDAAAARWVRGLDGVSVLAGEDPVLLGMSDPGTRVDAIRRTAREQLASAFDPARLVAAARRRDALIDANARPLAPAAIVRPSGSGALPVAGVPEGTEVLVPVRLTQGWGMTPARVTQSELQWTGQPPEPPITWPQTLFVPGGNP
jgi:hypothetical protein